MIAKMGDWVNTAVGGIKTHRRDLWLVVCMALVAWSAFNLGRIYAPNGPAARQAAISTAKSVKASASPKASAAPKPAVDKSDPRVFASKSSTGKKYYYSWCSSRIKDANKIWLADEATALAKGYTLAANCH